MKNNILFILIAFLSIFSGCMKDESLFIPDQGTPYNSNILGIVTDESNNPVEGAVVSFNGLTKTTDKNGIYQFKNVAVSSKHSFLKIRKAGYFDGSRAFNTQQPANIRLTNTLLAKSFNKTFNSSIGGYVAANGYSLNFPANSIKVESSGTSYNGTVKVAIKYLDPSLQSTFNSMPGNLVGLSLNNELNTLSTFGMLYVELQSSNGEKLQLKDSSQVAMTVNIPSSMIANAPATIPLWYFDESIGYWREEGEAILNTQTGTYTGSVNHFSIWNYDDNDPAINVSGKVVDQFGNPIICSLSFFENGKGGYGQTNFDGTYSGAIAKDKVLTLTITYYGSNCPGKILATKQVGPFSSDVVLADISINVNTGELFEFSADVNNCAGAQVLDGYARVFDTYGNHYFPIFNGHVTGSIISCFLPIVESITFVDEANFVESDPIIANGSGPHNLGLQLACGNVVDGWSVKCDSLNLNEFLNVAYVFDSVFSIQFVGYPIDSTNKLEIGNLEYSDGDPNNYATGPFTLTGGSFYHLQQNTNYNVIGGTINVTQGGTTGDKFQANYSAFVQKQGTVFTNTITGTIKWTIK